MRLSTLLLLLTSVLISAKQHSYAEVHQMPKSVEKDYYIWRLLKQKQTRKSEAKKIIKEAKRISPKLRNAYKKKTGKIISTRKKRHKAKPLSTQAKTALRHKQKHAKMIIAGDVPFQHWLDEPVASKIFVFNNIGKSGRKRLNHPISKSLWRKLTTHPRFNTMLKKIHKEGLNQLKKSFLFAPASRHALSYDSTNYLAFYALYAKKYTLSEKYFSLSAQAAKEREARDRALFWAYLTSKEKSYLKELVKSYDINLYTLLARDLLKLKYPKVIIPDLPHARLLNKQEAIDPIYWVKLKKKIFSKKQDLNRLAEQYRSAQTVGYYSYIKAKASREKAQYFPMPYRKLLSKLPKTRQAILYAIARQESRFIPGSISSSYALGMMQIMPFLVDHLAKQRGEDIDYDEMFDPVTALIYANDHMNYLTKWLQHPLYIAYAYNAGIGFTRRMLKKKTLFTHNKYYEPYLSIERLPNAQAKRYGKHVLANYVIYMNQLGVSLRMIDLLGTLHLPSKTDKFRK